MRVSCNFLLGWLAACAAIDAHAWNAQVLSVPVIVNNQTIPYSDFAVYLLPGQQFEVRFSDTAIAGAVVFRGETRPLNEQPLRAPDRPGLETLKLLNIDSGEETKINVFTMVPAQVVDARAKLNGYRIGAYPAEPLRGDAIYRPPAGFVEVTRENLNTRVSPSFTLGEFVSKQGEGFPKYVVLRTDLLLKLEQVLEALNQNGHRVDRFVIMSGFRTPFYNRAIGNVPYSRHVWGGAADIYIDENPKDGVMDDLNGDGSIDREDAAWLARFIDGLARLGEFGAHIGGLGVYSATSAHGPFVHVDARGVRARW